MEKTTKIYTVSQVSSLIKEVLENNLPGRLTITGEITDWSIAGSGHCYFSLKDENSLLPCVMWASKFRNIKFSPKDGMAVLAMGSIDVFIRGGKYQLHVDQLEPAGVGALQLAFERMKKKLQAEGLFDDVHKKAIPAYPERIGILTSESSAAVHDIEDSIHNRWPCVKLFLYPVPVQGEGAAERIAAAIRDVNKRNRDLKLDILIVGRGGGSLEDLWAFNEEVLARAIFDSQIPIISAVGHEIDVTVADLVADRRASTPTKAGVVAVPDIQEVLSDLASKATILKNSTRAQLGLARQNLQTILASEVFKKPLLTIRNREQQLDKLASDLADSIKELLALARDRLHRDYEQIVKIEPHRLLGEKRVDLIDLKSRAIAAVKTIMNNRQMQLTGPGNRLAQTMRGLLVEKERRVSASYEQVVRIKPHWVIGQRMVELSNLRNRANVGVRAILNERQMELTGADNRLAGLNPRVVLKRGYSISTNRETGLLVKTREDIRIGDYLVTELANENLIESKVTKK